MEVFYLPFHSVSTVDFLPLYISLIEAYIGQITKVRLSCYLVLLSNDSKNHPDSKVHGANMGPNWGRQDPGGPHVGPMNLAIWEGNKTGPPSWSDPYISLIEAEWHIYASVN